MFAIGIPTSIGGAWQACARLIIHQYDRIDPAVPYHVATAQLPAMCDRLRDLIAQERRLAGEANT